MGGEVLMFARCPHCSALVKAPDRYAGCAVTCPTCRESMPIPAPSATPRHIVPPLQPTSRADDMRRPMKHEPASLARTRSGSGRVEWARAWLVWPLVMVPLAASVSIGALCIVLGVVLWRHAALPPSREQINELCARHGLYARGPAISGLLRGRVLDASSFTSDATLPYGYDLKVYAAPDGRVVGFSHMWIQALNPAGGNILLSPPQVSGLSTQHERILDCIDDVTEYRLKIADALPWQVVTGEQRLTRMYKKPWDFELIERDWPAGGVIRSMIVRHYRWTRP